MRDAFALGLGLTFTNREPERRLAFGRVTNMNALPLKPTPPLSDLVDDLVANFGARRVLLALTARLIKRTRPPDTTGLPALSAQPGVDDLPDDIRADIGLPPKRVRPNPDLLAGYVSRHWM